MFVYKKGYICHAYVIIIRIVKEFGVVYNKVMTHIGIKRG